MKHKPDTALVEAVWEMAYPLEETSANYDPLMDLVGNAQLVLLGESTHGTHEFYKERAAITRRLILENQFDAIAVEADWPDAYRVNRYVRGASQDESPAEALEEFQRFPAWMWRNTDMVEFLHWLRAHNDVQPAGSKKVGFYGLDLYRLRASMNAVLEYLDKADPNLARVARIRYACFDQFGENGRAYGFLTGAGQAKSCREEAVMTLVDLQSLAAESAARNSRQRAEDDEELFNAMQNARLVKNAELYYRTMFLSDESTWNLRAHHMVEMLDMLVEHLDSRQGRAKIVVWAHNSHVGDALATDRSEKDEVSIGQLVRERYQDVMLIGFTTHHGTVTAASNWDRPVERKIVRPALPDSHEAIFHETGRDGLLLPCVKDEDVPVPDELREPLLQRSIGVIYSPDTERQSHYFHARLMRQFDAVVHIDETHAVEPLEPGAIWNVGEVPQTYPFAV